MKGKGALYPCNTAGEAQHLAVDPKIQYGSAVRYEIYVAAFRGGPFLDLSFTDLLALCTRVWWDVLVLLIFVPIHGALIAFLIALQWKCENLLGEKQPKFTETSTALLWLLLSDFSNVENLEEFLQIRTIVTSRITNPPIRLKRKHKHKKSLVNITLWICWYFILDELTLTRYGNCEVTGTLTKHPSTVTMALRTAVLRLRGNPQR